jgi:hypothetical protein
MNAITVLETVTSPEVLASGLLLRELVSIPARGAADAEISEQETRLGKPLSEGFRRFLRRWNGINLDVIRLYGTTNVSDGIESLTSPQPAALADFIAIGSDPAGFIYAEDSAGRIYSFDHDGGEVECVAHSFDEFIVDYVFGKNSAAFMGDDWYRQVITVLPGQSGER